MPRGPRWFHVMAHAFTLASALGVLVQDVSVPGYAAFHGDWLPWVALYAVVHVWALAVYAQDRPMVPWLTVAKAAIAVALLASFTADGMHQGDPGGDPAARLSFLNGFDASAAAWMRITPARYVYALFDWGSAAKVGMYGFLLLGRGMMNVVSAFVATAPWWRPLRDAQPILGRIVTAVAVAMVVTCAWGFLQLVKINGETYSVEAEGVAWAVFGGIDCATLRERQGTTVTQTLARGDRRYEARILYGCAETQVVVTAPDGRLGVARGARAECCAAPA
jgi:hypothetical protein